MKGSKSRLVIETIILTVLAIIAVVIIAGLVTIYSGLPNVAATSPHIALVAWVLSTTSDHAVEAAARSVTRPSDFNKISVRAGYHFYSTLCVMCHGAPGVDKQWVGKGLYPEPPSLYVSVKDLSPAEVFWVIKHGIKDTGMPALEPTHSDGEIWEIAALVKKLPEMTAQDYKAIGQESTVTEPPPAPAQ
jgi:mono/diheme cytochrome c family protein